METPHVRTPFSSASTCLLLILTLILWSPGNRAIAAPVAGKSLLPDAYGKLPISFEANRGQFDARVRFVSRGSGYDLFLTQSEAVLALKGANHKNSTATVVRMAYVGGNPAARIVGAGPLPGTSNYFIGKDPRRWHLGIPQYAGARHEGVYPGIDIVFSGKDGQLEYDFAVTPGADPNSILLRFSGADALSIDPHGNLQLRTAAGVIEHHAPLVYQMVGGERKAVKGEYILRDKELIGFRVASYDTSKLLVIDPVISYSTYLGGSDSDSASGIALDSSGNIYLVGSTFSFDFPVSAGAVQLGCAGGGYSVGCSDIFVTKLNASGTTLLYSTYLGGSNGNEQGAGIAVDSSGNTYITGATTSVDFPTYNYVQGAFVGGACPYSTCDDAFVTKLNASGTALLYSTYLGGNGEDFGNGIAVDTDGYAYVTGQTGSTNFPVTGGTFQATHGGGLPVQGMAYDAFVVRLSQTGSQLAYATYLGGVGDDIARAIAVDSSGNCFVTGRTSSANFPTTAGALQETLDGASDAFVARLNTTGTALLYATFLGGGGGDAANAIDTDASGNIYLAGETSSDDFPTVNPFQSACLGTPCQDGFVAKLSADGTTLSYSTYLGGSNATGDSPAGIAVDANGNAYVTGTTFSPDFPTVDPFQSGCGLDSISGQCWDAFVTKFGPSGSAVYSTFLGGSSNDNGAAIAVDGTGKAFIAGTTYSRNLVTVNPYQKFAKGGSDAFVAVVYDSAATADLSLAMTDSPDPVGPGGLVTYILTISNNGPDTAPGVTLTDLLPPTFSFSSASASQGACDTFDATYKSVTCTLGSLASGGSATVTIVAQTSVTGTRTNTASVKSGVSDPVTANNTATTQTNVVPCSYSVEQPNSQYPSSGGTGTVSVTSPPGCGWNAVSSFYWIVISSGQNGSGNGTVAYMVDPNIYPGARAGSITVAGIALDVNQSASWPVALLSPNGGERLAAGQVSTVRWQAPYNAVKFNLAYSTDNGLSWKLIAANVVGESYNWTVPAPLNNKAKCLLKVTGFTAGGAKVGSDRSNASFAIEVVRVTSPNGGESLASQGEWAVTWSTNATKRPVAKVKLLYTLNGGYTWKLLQGLSGNPGGYNWTLPAIVQQKQRCKVKVVLYDQAGVAVGSDLSDGFFIINP